MIEFEAERLGEALDELDRLERLAGRAIRARELADALGWSSTHLAEAVLDEAVELGFAVGKADEGYRLG